MIESHVMKVMQIIQVMQVIQMRHGMKAMLEMQGSQVMQVIQVSLAHLWVDFRVISFFLRNFLKYFEWNGQCLYLSIEL